MPVNNCHNIVILTVSGLVARTVPNSVNTFVLVYILQLQLGATFASRFDVASL
jgi:hypothetical protein